MPRWALAFLLLSSCAWAAPLPENPAGRRAVRGSPVETVHESDELRALRQFDEESFAPGAPAPPLPNEPAASSVRQLSSMSVGPDAIPAPLRSPGHELVKPIETASAIPWLDQLKSPDLPVRFDPRVVRYLEFYKSDRRGRAIMTSWLKKEGRWKAMFEEALRRAKLPLSLTYVSMIESGFDPNDRSHAGAVGLWQFMPEGGRIYGLRIDYWIDERKSPEKATQAFVQYIGDLKERFGAWPLALAAFNAGYGAVLRSMQKYNSNDYWELCRHEDGLPWDTVLYVPKAMAVALVGENKKLFGYDEVKVDPPFAFDHVSVPSSMSVTAIAKAAGSTPAEIAALNPELRRNRTPPEAWQARVPRGSAARFAASWEQHREMVKPFVVRFGERLEDIAAAHGASPRELRALNGIDDSGDVRPGLTLLVPDGKKPTAPPPCDTQIVAVPDKDAVVAGRKRVFYRTLPQDSPSEIAAFFKVKPTDLARWNNVDLDAKLANNMVLQLWVANDFDSSKAALVDPARVRVVTVGSPEFFDLVEARRGRKRLAYVIKKGDDLKKVAKKFNLTVADLERINRFGAAHTELVVGQKVVVYIPLTAAEKAKAACALTPGGLEPDAREAAKEPADSTKESLDAPKEPAPPRDPIVDEQERAEEGVVVSPGDKRSLPRPPPSDGRP
ncbi:MAG: Lytic transglycosylase catalytic [Myxococcales bacterium]|nr:Lytic transglycosylase catalytic [Myxococcales bacterium]